MIPAMPDDVQQEEHRERIDLLERIDRWLEWPMLALAFLWLVLLVIELVRGQDATLTSLTLAIWVVFILHFAVQLALAPRRLEYLRKHWLTALSLVLPALRILRVAPLLRILRAARGLRLLKVVGSLNRGMRALGATMGRRGFGYVVALTAIVTFVGAAGIYAFESEHPAGMRSYGDALWWTSMIMTTMGSEYWPRSPEGRLLCLLLATYAFAMFGYVTATLASHFVGRDAASDESDVAGANTLQELRREIADLRTEIAALADRLPGPLR
jgi:voltage-gated potassium channel